MTKEKTEPTSIRPQINLRDNVSIESFRIMNSRGIISTAQNLVTWYDNVRIAHGVDGSKSEDARSREMLGKLLGDKNSDSNARHVLKIVEFGRSEEEVNARGFSIIAVSALVITAYYGVRDITDASFINGIKEIVRSVHKEFPHNHRESHGLWNTLEGQYTALIFSYAKGLINPAMSAAKRKEIIVLIEHYSQGVALTEKEKEEAGIVNSSFPALGKKQ